VGKCIAESKTSVGSTFITLTYGRDENNEESHVRSSILTYSDVQKFIKQLRFRGFPCRYIAVGEYGSEKGRAHWHIIVFWQKTVPTVMMDHGNASWHRAERDVPVPVKIIPFKRMNIPPWPHGFSQWDPVAPGNEKGSIRYACKYINKDFGDEGWQGKFAMSKTPPLGAAYFFNRAQRFVDERLSPQDPYYQFPDDARRKDGTIIRFKLAGRSLELFIEAFLSKWKEQVGGHEPPSEMIEEYLDKKTREKIASDGTFRASDKKDIDVLVRPARRFPFNPPMGYADADIYFDSFRPDDVWADAPRIDTPEGPIWYGPNSEGVKGWRNMVPVVETKVRTTGLPVLPASKLIRFHLDRESVPPKFVYWLPKASLLGQWKKSKLPVALTGKKEWMRSHKS